MSDWPTDEDSDILEPWLDRVSGHHLAKVPVGHPSPAQWVTRTSGNKQIDAVLFKQLSSDDIDRAQEHLNSSRAGFNFARDSSSSDIETQFRAIVETWPSDTLPVQIVEAKRELNFKGLGQVIGYSALVEEYYTTSRTRVEVADRILVYGENDRAVRAAAKAEGITCEAVAPPGYE